MSDKTPTNVGEYAERQNRNNYVTGFGADTEMHVACPFCAAAEFMACKVLNTQAAMTEGAVCRECGRGAKAIFQQSAGALQFEFV